MRRLYISRKSWVALGIIAEVLVLAYLEQDYCNGQADAGRDAHAFNPYLPPPED